LKREKKKPIEITTLPTLLCLVQGLGLAAFDSKFQSQKYQHSLIGLRKLFNNNLYTLHNV